MYDTAKQAAKAYDAAAIELGKSLSKFNFPKKVPPGYTPTNNGQRSDNTSGYRGVTNKGKYGYQAMIYMNDKNTNLGLFNTRKQAAVAYDHAVHKHHLPSSRLNFPSMKHNLNKEPKGRKKPKVSSTGFRGVYEGKSGKYYARLGDIRDTNYYSKGGFATAKAAAVDYDAHIVANFEFDSIVDELNFPEHVEEQHETYSVPEDFSQTDEDEDEEDVGGPRMTDAQLAVLKLSMGPSGCSKTAKYNTLDADGCMLTVHTSFLCNASNEASIRGKFKYN